MKQREILEVSVGLIPGIMPFRKEDFKINIRESPRNGLLKIWALGGYLNMVLLKEIALDTLFEGHILRGHFTDIIDLVRAMTKWLDLSPKSKNAAEMCTAVKEFFNSQFMVHMDDIPRAKECKKWLDKYTPGKTVIGVDLMSYEDGTEEIEGNLYAKADDVDEKIAMARKEVDEMTSFLACANSLKRNSIRTNVGVFGLLDMKAVYVLLRMKYPEGLQHVLAAKGEARTSLLSTLITTALFVCLVDCGALDERIVKAGDPDCVEQNRCDQK
uniref:Uncharacterized protein n=1 Tax=Glossina pallidipes TaxID=7398 RepID=A0A1B0A0R4_GLOPL